MSPVTNDPRPVGVLLVNLGSPEAPTAGAVRRYLREFLSDPRVLDIPAPVRRTLLETVILPIRSRRSAALYRSIWDPVTGSPLTHHTATLAQQVQASLGKGWVVKWAMRYGEPSIATGWSALKNAQVRQVVVVPLYPQGTSSTVGSVLDEVHTQAARDWVPTPMTVVPPFHDVDGFIESWTEVAGPVLADADADHVLFSFHSVPQRHLTKADATGGHCLLSTDCCDLRSSPVAAGCYRAQCVRTAQRLAVSLDLAPQAWSISFQSRLGRIPWVEPYTDLELTRLREQGVLRVAVLCPAFVSDNLETLEEIGIRARRQWLGAGGEELVLVPSLNGNERWVQAVVDLVRERAGSEPQAFGLH